MGGARVCAEQGDVAFNGQGRAFLIDTFSMSLNWNVTLLLSDPGRQNREEPKYFMLKFINNGA